MAAKRASGAAMPSWTCFHCGETFTDPEDARLHFGDNGMADAACQIDIKAFREMETLVARWWAEDGDADRALYRMQAEHTVALHRAEEKGYERGLRDQIVLVCGAEPLA